MKRTTIAVLTALLLTAAACSKRSGGGGIKLRTDTDSIAYIIGMNVGMNLLKTDSTLNVSALCEGIRDVFRAAPKFTAGEAQAYYLRYVNHTLPERARAYEAQFIEDIVKSNRSYARTASGAAYTVAEVGDQERVPAADRDSVVLRWVSRTADGAAVYSSYERGDTVRTTLGDLKPGVRESIKLIGPGGRLEAWVPSAAAYGADGDETLGIRPNTTLRYEIELIGVDKYADRFRRGNLRR